MESQLNLVSCFTNWGKCLGPSKLHSHPASGYHGNTAGPQASACYSHLAGHLVALLLAADNIPLEFFTSLQVLLGLC